MPLLLRPTEGCVTGTSGHKTRALNYTAEEKKRRETLEYKSLGPGRDKSQSKILPRGKRGDLISMWFPNLS